MHIYTQSYGRVTAPFSQGRKHVFHEVPFLDERDDMLKKGTDPGCDKSDLLYFSPCER
jgi:hypothetical protein